MPKINCRLKKNRSKSVCKKKRLGSSVSKKKINVGSKKREIDRVLKFILIPLILITLFLMTVVSEFRIGGFVALALAVFTYIIYITPRFQKTLIGIPDNVFKGFWWGAGLFGFFFFLMVFSPTLSIAVPTVPQALTELSIGMLNLGKFFSIFVVVILYPFLETGWKISMLNILTGFYRLSITISVFIIAIFFSLLHSLAYGVQLAFAETFGTALQQLNLIGGVLFTAGLFGTLATITLLRTKNFLPVALAHSAINLVIITTTFSIIAIL